MPFDPNNAPRESEADLQHRLDIIEGRKIPNYALDVKEMRQSTQVTGELAFIKTPPSPKPNIR